MATRPKVMLLDEPTSAMDDQTEQSVLRAMAQDLQGVTMVISTHRHSLLAIATRVIVLEAGTVILDAPRDQAVEILKKGLQVNPNAPAASPMSPMGHTPPQVPKPPPQAAQMPQPPRPPQPPQAPPAPPTPHPRAAPAAGAQPGAAS